MWFEISASRAVDFHLLSAVSLDKLLDARDLPDALRRMRTEDEHAEIMREIADLQDQNSSKDEGMDP